LSSSNKGGGWGFCSAGSRAGWQQALPFLTLCRRQNILCSSTRRQEEERLWTHSGLCHWFLKACLCGGAGREGQGLHSVWRSLLGFGWAPMKALYIGGGGLLLPSMPQGRLFRRGGQSAGGVVWWETSPEERVTPSGSEVRV